MFSINGTEKEVIESWSMFVSLYARIAFFSEHWQHIFENLEDSKEKQKKLPCLLQESSPVADSTGGTTSAAAWECPRHSLSCGAHSPWNDVRRGNGPPGTDSGRRSDANHTLHPLKSRLRSTNSLVVKFKQKSQSWQIRSEARLVNSQAHGCLS